MFANPSVFRLQTCLILVNGSDRGACLRANYHSPDPGNEDEIQKGGRGRVSRPQGCPGPSVFLVSPQHLAKVNIEVGKIHLPLTSQDCSSMANGDRRCA